ncbi:hypothetical protein RJ639_027145 [Escallonia herrerae]|uniref:non-specific serine/threonine protein kinase n=1 Tax=Escallonia herrerae TaxID=1293975 RepID=A0AA88X511_9ASTE|nr:hypothetical protein RJ639_027145 [Escallonia herrerae]
MVLLQFKNSISDPSGLLSSWKPESSNYCSWFGVTCSLDSRVLGLKIAGNGCYGGNTSSRYKYSEFTTFHVTGIRRNRCDGNGKLAGKLSPVIGKLTELRVLSLPFNELSGELPVEIWGLENLEVLDLEGNIITGKLPSEFAGSRKLRVLNLGFNEIVGQIPGSLSKCRGLQVLNLAENQVEGLVPEFLFSFKKLKGLYLSFNQLVGSVPDELAKSRYLEHLDLSGNFLIGKIPHSLGNCSRLRTLSLFSNAFDGVIPPELGLLRKLEVLDVSENKLAGSLHENLFRKCVGLKGIMVDVSDNRGRQIRSNLDVTYGSLKLLDASRNMIFGPLPRCLGDLRSLVVLNLSGNRLHGQIPVDLSHLKDLKYLSLAGNNLTGATRSLFAQLHSLEHIDLSSNSLSGKITQGLVNLENLTVLLPKNIKLLENIPLDLAKMTSLSVGDASSNNLSEPLLPGSKVMNGCIFIGRRFLASRPVYSLSIPSSDLQSKNESQNPASDANRGSTGFHTIEIASITSASVIVAVLLVLVAVYVYSKKWTPSSNTQVSASFERREIVAFKNIGVPLTFENVVQAAGNFTASNCIGGGGFGATYRAEVSPGITVAVKRLTLERRQGVRQFEAEINALRRIRHPNLITLIGYYASEAEMFLIYNYLSGGNLEQLIQERARKAFEWKADVYSYGVVLLELISDKKALDPSFSSHENGFTIVTWACLLLSHGQAKEAFTAGLWDEGPQDDLVAILHLAIQCTSEALSGRPTMRQVVRRLRQLQPPQG